MDFNQFANHCHCLPIFQGQASLMQFVPSQLPHSRQTQPVSSLYGCPPPPSSFAATAYPPMFLQTPPSCFQLAPPPPMQGIFPPHFPTVVTNMALAQLPPAPQLPLQVPQDELQKPKAIYTGLDGRPFFHLNIPMLDENGQVFIAPLPVPASEFAFHSPAEQQQYLNAVAFSGTGAGYFNSSRAEKQLVPWKENPVKENGEPYHCKFCASNNETPRFVRSHDLHDENGIVTCPILRNLVCETCQATGDNAHTKRYCPLRKQKEDDDSSIEDEDKGPNRRRYIDLRNAAGGYSLRKY